jgi:DNA-3-methyladenine glycosylase
MRTREEKLGREFYAREAEVVARELIGMTLVHRVDGAREERRARIVETEAYVGVHDLACHAAKGRTKRTEVMFGEAGHAYVYLIYGMYDLLNVVTGEVGDAQAVLIRAGEALGGGGEGDLRGPGKLARGMRITRVFNGVDMTGESLFFVRGEGVRRMGESARIGVDYAGAWKDAVLRFFDAESAAVSGVRRGGR